MHVGFECVAVAAAAVLLLLRVPTSCCMKFSGQVGFECITVQAAAVLLLIGALLCV